MEFSASRFESSKSFQPDTFIVYEGECAVSVPNEDPDEEFPTKKEAGLAVYNDIHGDHTAHVIVFEAAGVVLFQTPLEASVLTSQFKSNISPPNSFKLTSCEEADSNIEVILPSAKIVNEVAMAMVAAVFKATGGVKPVALPLNKRESRRNAQIPPGNVAVLDVQGCSAFEMLMMDCVGSHDSASIDTPLPLKFKTSDDPSQLAPGSPRSGDKNDPSDVMKLLLSDANEGLVFAMAFDPKVSSNGEWNDAMSDPLYKNIPDLDDHATLCVAFLTKVSGSEEYDADAEKSAIKKRLQRQGGASMFDGAPSSNNNSFAEMAAARARASSKIEPAAPVPPPAPPAAAPPSKSEDASPADSASPVEAMEEEAPVKKSKKSKKKSKQQEEEQELTDAVTALEPATQAEPADDHPLQEAAPQPVTSQHHSSREIIEENGSFAENPKDLPLPKKEKKSKKEKKPRRNRDTEADDLVAFLEADAVGASAPVDSEEAPAANAEPKVEVYEPAADQFSSPTDPGTAEVFRKIANADQTVTKEELQRASEKLERKKQRLLKYEAELLTQMDDLRHREQLLETKHAELSLMETTLRTNQISFEQDRERFESSQPRLSKNSASPQREAEPGSAEKGSSRRDRYSEKSALLMGSTNYRDSTTSNPETFVYKVENNFFDNNELPEAIFEQYPIAAWLIHILTRKPAAGILIAASLAGIGISSIDFTSTWPAVILCCICTVLYASVVYSSRFYNDQLHLIDQSCNCPSDPVEASIYCFHPIFAVLPIFTLLASLGSIAVVTVGSLSALSIAGLVFALGGSALMFGTALNFFLLSAYTCRERIAQTVPSQHGAVTSRVNIRAALARYQYLKTIVHTTSSAWSLDTFLIVLVAAYGFLFAIYNVTLHKQESLVSFSNALLSTTVFTVASIVGSLILCNISGWEDATRNVIGAVSSHLDRWARGDLNHATDAKAEDFVTLQTALAMSIQGFHHARWAMRKPPFTKGSRFIDVPSVLGPMFVVFSVVGAVLIPVVAAYHVNNLH